MPPLPKHSAANAAIRAGSTSAIVKFSVMPSPWMPTTATPSASKLARILSLSASMYGVTMPTRRAPRAVIARPHRRGDADGLGAGLGCEIRSISSRLVRRCRGARPRWCSRTRPRRAAPCRRRARRSAGARRASPTRASGVVSSSSIRAVWRVAPAGSRRYRSGSITVFDDGTIRPTRALTARPPCAAARPREPDRCPPRSPSARGRRRQLEQIERVVADHRARRHPPRCPTRAPTARTRAAPRPASGCAAGPASLIRIDRSGPTARIASTTFVSGAWPHIADTVQYPNSA